MPQGVEHLGQQGSQTADQRWVCEDLQECTKERNQTHLFLSFLVRDDSLFRHMGG